MKRESLQTAVDLAICAVVILLYLSICHIAHAQTKPAEHPPLGTVRLAVEVRRVVNGDTIEGKINFPWGSGQPGLIKMIGFEAVGSEPSLPRDSNRQQPTPPTAEETKASKANMRALQEILDQGELYAEPEGAGSYDNCGRRLARLWVKDEGGEIIDVARAMRSKGHSRASDGQGDFQPAKPVGPVKPKASTSGQRAAKRLQQLASQPQGIMAPQGGGFGGWEPQCAKTRAAQLARRQGT